MNQRPNHSFRFTHLFESLEPGLLADLDHVLEHLLASRLVLTELLHGRGQVVLGRPAGDHLGVRHHYGYREGLEGERN